MGLLGPGARGGQAADPEVERLIERFDAAEGEERRQIARELGKMGEKAAPAIPGMISMLDSNQYGDKKAAREALVGIGRPAVAPMMELLREGGPRSYHARDVLRQTVRRNGSIEIGQSAKDLPNEP